MAEQQLPRPAHPPINGRYRIPFSVWAIIFRFAAGTSYFASLDRSPLEPVVYDEFGDIIGYDQTVAEAYAEHKATLTCLLAVCREWREVLRHFRMEWTIIRDRTVLTELLRSPTEPGFLPIHRLDLRISLLNGLHTTRSTRRDLAMLLSYCERLEVLTIITSDQDIPSAAFSSDIYMQDISQVCATRPHFQKLAMNLPVANVGRIISLLNESRSIRTLDICVAPGPAHEVAPGSCSTLGSLRISFDDCAPRILHDLVEHELPALTYVWIADYVDPMEEANHPTFMSALQSFLASHGAHLRSLVLVSNAYGLTMETWVAVMESCSGLAEFSCSLPVDIGFVYARPLRGLPHPAIHTVAFTGFSALMHSESPDVRTEAFRFLSALPSTDFPSLRVVRLDFSFRFDGNQPIAQTARRFLDPLARLCDSHGARLEDSEGRSILHVV